MFAVVRTATVVQNVRRREADEAAEVPLEVALLQIRDLLANQTGGAPKP